MTRIGPCEENQLWDGRPVNQACAVFIDGQRTDRPVKWYDPDKQEYGYYKIVDGTTVLDPENPEECLIIIADGVVTLEFPDDDTV